MSRSAAAQRKAVRVTVSTLARLGTERLAELLSAAAKADTSLRRALALEVADGAMEIGEEVDRQLDRIRAGKGRLTAPRAGKLVRELERVIDVLGGRLSACDPGAAVCRLLTVIALADAVLPRRTGDTGAMLQLFASAGECLATTLARTPGGDQRQLAEALHTALLAKGAGVSEELPAQVYAALGSEGRQASRALIEADLAGAEHQPGRGAAGRQVGRCIALLGHLADAEGDVDAFLSAQARRAAPLRDHTGSARRLLGAGRADEALGILDAASPAKVASAPGYADLRIQALDALGRRDEAQAARWRLFKATLSVDALRQHLKRLPGFDDVEREEEALEHVMRHEHTTAALAFLMAWPDHRRAGALVRARQGRLDGAAGEVVEPAANALTSRDPLAATLVLRAMIETALEDGRAATNRRARLLLAECATLAAAINDWEGCPPHETYAASLQFIARRGSRSGRRRRSSRHGGDT